MGLEARGGGAITVPGKGGRPVTLEAKHAGRRGVPRRVSTALLGLAAAASLAGCGAAYYGAAIGIIATQKKTRTIDESFPDAVPTNAVAPSFATLVLSSGQVTIQRDTQAFDPTGAGAAITTETTISLTGFEVERVELPPGYGEALSNRDAGTTLGTGDRLVVRINGDRAQAITFDAADAATVGSAVAARLQARVRALTPVDADVPAAAYQLFTASFDRTTGSYTCRSGAAGERSEVVFEPTPRQGRGDAEPDAASGVTSTRLGLGVTRGGIETSGAESVRVVVLNRGTDAIPQGTAIDLYLSKDKVLSRRTDLLIDRFFTDQTVAVGEARRFTRRNGASPPTRLLRQDFTPGPYYLLFDVASSGGERVLDNNLTLAPQFVQVAQPIDDPATTQVETANALDFVPVGTRSPISVLTGATFSTAVTVENFGAAVPAATTVDLDLVLSSDAVLDEPADFRDPNGLLAGVRINPTDPSLPVTVQVSSQGTGAITAAVVGATISVSFNGGATGAGVATVQSLIDVLNGSSGTLVDAFSDGVASTTTSTLTALLTAANKSSAVAKDLFVATRRVSYPAGDRPRLPQSYGLEGTIRATALKAAVLPVRLLPLFRIRPQLPAQAGTGAQNQRNDVRQGANYVRVYDRARATFDATTGATLPTANSDDFATLAAVTQRPVNTGSLRQGQQRVFRFELPASGLTQDESQLLLVLRTPTFDAHVDLLSSSGSWITGVDDSALGKDPVLYLPVQASAQSRSIYLVVAPARADESDLAGGGETFELTISVNSRQTGDLGLVKAVDAGDIVRAVNQRYATAETPRVENRVLIPYSLSNGKAELQFVLPKRARVRLASRPLFAASVRTTITRFLAGQVPAPVEHQLELDEARGAVVLRPAGGTIQNAHVLEEGVYTLAIEGISGATDAQDLRLEVDVEFIPPS